jgi:hypothetical protein
MAIYPLSSATILAARMSCGCSARGLRPAAVVAIDTPVEQLTMTMILVRIIYHDSYKYYYKLPYSLDST